MEKVHKIIELMFNPEKYLERHKELQNNPEKLEQFLKLQSIGKVVTREANKIKQHIK
jgi:hypothetical protein